MRENIFQKKSWLFTAIALFTIASCGGGNPPVAPDPPVGPALEGVQFFEGWTDPRKLGDPINTAGWEDSAFISYDGTTLFFGYSPLDYYSFTQGSMVSVGPTGAPERPGQHGDNFDIYEARIESGSWTIANSSANASDPQIHEAAIGVDRDSSIMAFIRFDPEGDIYLTQKQPDGAWGTPQLLPSPFNTPCVEDNPHLSANGMSLYFDSNRDDINGTTCIDESAGLQRSIYVSTYSSGSWSLPQKVTGDPAGHSNAWQVFVTDDGIYLYWSGACSGGGSCLYRARKLTDGSYGEETVIAQATSASPSAGDVIAVGEMSITGDGRFLYFVYVQYNSATDLELGIGVARKQ